MIKFKNDTNSSSLGAAFFPSFPLAAALLASSLFSVVYGYCLLLSFCDISLLSYNSKLIMID
jgi:hypothetical protein